MLIPLPPTPFSLPQVIPNIFLLFCIFLVYCVFHDVPREQSSDISETGVSENDENPVRIISVTPAKTEPVKNKVCPGILWIDICDKFDIGVFFSAPIL